MPELRTFLKQLPLVKRILEARRNHRRARIVRTLEQHGSLLDGLDERAKQSWGSRIQLVLEAADNGRIRHVPGAGTFNERNDLIMHNGLLIDIESYYGLPMLEMLFKNKGVHEPQEEYVFQEVLRHIPDNGVMIELGAYWSFYSMWFNQQVAHARNYMIEPVDVGSGMTNFSLNNMQGDFTKAFISSCAEHVEDASGTPTLCVDGFVQDKRIAFIDILHADIQGHELRMLHGAADTLANRKVGYVFISTHSQDLHAECMEYLRSHGYLLVCSCDMDESYSVDGLLVFKDPAYPGPETIAVSKRAVKRP